MFEFLFIITLLLFAGSSILIVASWKSENNKYNIPALIIFILADICFISLGIFKLLVSFGGSILNFVSGIWGYFYIFSLLIILTTIYLYFKRWPKLKSYIVIISFFIAIIMLLSIPFEESPRKFLFNSNNNSLPSYILPVHILFSIIGEILFFFSFAGSLLFLIMERNLKDKASMKLIYQLPNLESINNFNKWSISRSFVFISFGLITGIIMNYIIFNAFSLATAKEFHIYFSWIVISVVFYIRNYLKLPSHKACILNIILFVLIMFLFIFTNIFIRKGFHSFI
jgi:ABC-type uncharacterized transport system permease subunit